MSGNDRGYSIPRANPIPSAAEASKIGPGYYSHSETLGKQGISIPKAGRNELDRADNNKLGPGAYNISRDIVGKERGTFNKQKRILAGEEEGGDPELAHLGPGAYAIQDDTFKKDNGRGVTILGKPRPQSAAPGSKLGPGQYYKDAGVLNNEAYSFSKGNRGALTWNEANKVGPGQYGAMRDKNFLQKGKGVSFARSKRMNDKCDNNLGPGQYSKQTAKRTKAIRPESAYGTFGTAERKIGERLRDTGASGANLGPGYYSRKEKPGNGWSFGKEQRDQALNKLGNQVGPGAYSLKPTFSQKGGLIGTSTRDPKDKINKTPGFYKVPATVPDVPKYLLPPEKNRKIHL